MILLLQRNRACETTLLYDGGRCRGGGRPVLKSARDFNEAGLRADVFVGRAASYTDDLEPKLRSGLHELGLGPAAFKGKTVLLKPNLVEPTRNDPQINTHPAVVRAAAEVFRRWQAREVIVAEGQGHCRDSQYVLDQSGLAPVLAESRLEFIDLNHDDVVSVPNALGYTRLRELMLPVTLRRADVVVSMPKMKTHHWAGVTLALKNLFGVMPGMCYGWPKNVLHHAGIPESILDIAAAVRPDLAIVDGIIGMEGDGPIMGTPRVSGVMILGTNLPAVDATCARRWASTRGAWPISRVLRVGSAQSPRPTSHSAASRSRGSFSAILS